MESRLIMRRTVPLGVAYITLTNPMRAGEMYEEPLRFFCFLKRVKILIVKHVSAVLLTERA